MNELSPKASALVRAGRAAMRPSASDRERVSALLRARLGDAVLPLEAGATTSLLSRSVWAKLSVATVALGIVGGAAYMAWPKSEPKPANVAQTEPAHIEPPKAVFPSPSTLPRADSESISSAMPEAPTAARRPSDRLAQEVAILSRATSELHAGHPANALKAVDEHQRKFPNGVLSEERRAARVQALCALGRRREAAPELQRLSRTAPQSPNTLRAKQVCGEK